MPTTSNYEARLDRLAYSIFATLYAEYGYGETTAWNEAYRKAAKIINRSNEQ